MGTDLEEEGHGHWTIRICSKIVYKIFEYTGSQALDNQTELDGEFTTTLQIGTSKVSLMGILLQKKWVLSYLANTGLFMPRQFFLCTQLYVFINNYI